MTRKNKALPRKPEHRGGSFSRTVDVLRQELERYHYWETLGNKALHMLRMNR
ncbi:MAG TPA: hypothetical protein VN039_03540 [Nitrospira sp.]|nr:hypothetical protein [Nitrospira sp.]